MLWENKIINKINQMPIEVFEVFCFHLFTKLSFSNITTSKTKRPGEITGQATIELGILSQQFVFLAKQETSAAASNIISQIREQADNYTNKGILLSTGKFSRQTKKEAKSKATLPIDLIDRENLAARLKKIRLEIIKNTHESLSQEDKWLKGLLV